MITSNTKLFAPNIQRSLRSVTIVRCLELNMNRLTSWLAGAAGILISILALLALFFKNKADQNGVAEIEAKTQGADAGLVDQQNANKRKLDDVNKSIQDLKNEKENLRNQYLTDQQRADQWDKPQK